MRKCSVESRNQARRDGADKGNGAWARRDGADMGNIAQAREECTKPGGMAAETRRSRAGRKAAGLRVKEIKRTDTYPDLRYLATGLWTYIITTGLTTGFTKWITGGGGL